MRRLLGMNGLGVARWPGLVLLGSTLAACSSGGEGLPAARDACVVVLDALRADALGVYGSGRETSPELDGFAASGVLVERAFAPAAYTLASTASLFTGLGPAAHGTLGLATNVLPDGCATLAEALVDAGFVTAAFSSNPNVCQPGGFDQGFERFEFYLRDRFDVHTVPQSLTGDLVDFWRTEEHRPRFAYVHVLPPHAPYDASPPFDELFGADATRDEEGTHEHLMKLGRRAGLSSDSPEVRRVRARYDAGVRAADAWFGELEQALAVEWEDALVVVTSDHGESFAEHGSLSHGPSVHVEAVHVPFLARWPGVRARRVATPLATVDLAATLCEALGAGWEGGGVSFWAELTGGRPAQGRIALSRSMGQRPLWALRRDGWTLVAQPASGHRQLYRDRGDPLERRDVSAEHPERAEQLARELRSLLDDDLARRVTSTGPRRHTTLTNELAALGYVENAEDLPRERTGPDQSEAVEPADEEP